MKYKFQDGEKLRLIRAKIANDTVIEAGDLVGISSGLIVKADASSAKIAFCPNGHASGDGTEVEVTVGNDFTLKGTGDAVFAASYRGGEYDINSTTQTIDYGASSTDVLTVDISENAGIVDELDNVVVRINKPLF